jgi:hypothetical protein
MANAFSKIKLGYTDLFVLSSVLIGLILLIYYSSRMVTNPAAKNETDESQMEIDPDRVDVVPVPKILEINIVSRQTIFFKDEQGWFIPDEASRPAIVNTCDRPLYNFKVVWHLPKQRDNPLPEMVANILDLSEALKDRDVLDSHKTENQGNSCEVTPSFLWPGESAPITALSRGVHKQIDESGFAKGHLYVVAEAADEIRLTMVYGFELEPHTTSPESMLCRIVELSGIANNQSGPKQ